MRFSFLALHYVVVWIDAEFNSLNCVDGWTDGHRIYVYL